MFFFDCIAFTFLFLPVLFTVAVGLLYTFCNNSNPKLPEIQASLKDLAGRIRKTAQLPLPVTRDQERKKRRVTSQRRQSYSPLRLAEIRQNLLEASRLRPPLPEELISSLPRVLVEHAGIKQFLLYICRSVL